MNTFTPGPWEARTGRANTSVYIQGTGHSVAIGCREADARLIAAAPELYAVLASVSQSDVHPALWVRIRAALARADAAAHDAHYVTITPELARDRSMLSARIRGAIGPITARDVGKRVYLTPGEYDVQVENDEQLARRLAGGRDL